MISLSNFETDNYSKMNSQNTKQRAISLKEFLIRYMDRKMEESKNSVVSINDLNLAVAESPHCYFLREYFEIDSRSILKRLHMFLLTYPDQFIVDSKSGFVRFTKPDEKSPQNLHSSIISRANEFLTLCLSLQPEFKIRIKQLYDYLKYSAIDVQSYLDNMEFFKKFLEEHKDRFCVEQDFVCLTSSQNKSKKQDSKIEEIIIEQRLMNNTKFVNDLKTGLQVKQLIESKADIIALDCEGTHLGENVGSLTLIQVAFLEYKLASARQESILDNIRVFIFDILQCNELVAECIEPLLANQNIKKIMHNPKNDFAALKLYFGISEVLTVFDTSCYYQKFTKSAKNGLHTIYEEITDQTGLNFKPAMKQLYQRNFRIWEERPLSGFLRFYAAFDVLCLLSIYLWIDEKYEIKPTMFIKKLNGDDEPIYKAVVDEDDDLLILEVSNKSDKNKKSIPPPRSPKKTPEQLEALRAKFEHLEKIARGEIEEFSS